MRCFFSANHHHYYVPLLLLLFFLFLCDSANSVTPPGNRNGVASLTYNPPSIQMQTFWRNALLSEREKQNPRNQDYNLRLEYKLPTGPVQFNPEREQPRHSNVRRIPGDGNCLFRAISYSMLGTDKLHWKVRQKVAEYFASFVVNPHLLAQEPWIQTAFEGDMLREHAEKIARDGEWGLEEDIIAAAKTFQISIIVYYSTVDEDGHTYFWWMCFSPLITNLGYSEQDTQLPSILLKYSEYGRNLQHYDVIMRIGRQRQEQQEGYPSNVQTQRLTPVDEKWELAMVEGKPERAMEIAQREYDLATRERNTKWAEKAQRRYWMAKEVLDQMVEVQKKEEEEKERRTFAGAIKAKEEKRREKEKKLEESRRKAEARSRERKERESEEQRRKEAAKRSEFIQAAQFMDGYGSQSTWMDEQKRLMAQFEEKANEARLLDEQKRDQAEWERMKEATRNDAEIARKMAEEEEQANAKPRHSNWWHWGHRNRSISLSTAAEGSTTSVEPTVQMGTGHWSQWSQRGVAPIGGIPEEQSGDPRKGGIHYPTGWAGSGLTPFSTVPIAAPAASAGASPEGQSEQSPPGQTNPVSHECGIECKIKGIH